MAKVTAPIHEVLDPEEYSSKELEPSVPEVPTDYDFSPDELRQRMGLAAWEYRQAIEGMRKLEVTKGVRENKTTVILSARRFEKLTNRKLAAYLAETFEKDPKLRPTKEQYSSWIYIEHQDIFDAYNYWEVQAKRAEKDHDHWARQLSWYQSSMKHEGIEMTMLNTQRG